MENYGNIPEYLKFLNKFIALELWFTKENYGTMEIKLWYYGKICYYTENYGTFIYKEKTMVL